MLLLIPFSGFPALSTCLVGLRQATRTKRQCMKKKKKKEKREIVVVMAIMTGGCLSDSQFHFHSLPPHSALHSP